MTTVRDDLKFSFNQGYRDIVSSLGKMEDLVHDIALSKTAKETQLPKLKVNESEKVWYRKILIQNNQTYVISVMDSVMGDSLMIKLRVFEASSHEQHLFVFNARDIFTAQELEILGERQDKEIVAHYKQAVEKRLCIKELDVSGHSFEKITDL